MPITKVAVKIDLTDEIDAEVRVHRVAMAGRVAQVALEEIVRPANAGDREQGQAVVLPSARDAVILIAVNRANAVRLRRRCRRLMSR
jgi:hypothetical protein